MLYYLLSIFVFFYSSLIFARPEYALRHGIVNCTACHVGATGGSALRLNGKQYIGSVTENVPGFLSLNDTYWGDLRGFYFIPQKTRTTKTGLVLMEATAAVKPTIIRGKNSKWQMEALASYNLGVVSSGIRDMYLLFRDVHEKISFLPSHIQFGRFNVPFGLFTDEHRTYVRMQTRTTINDYEMGFLFSATPQDRFHYDIAITNGFQTGGTFTAQDFSAAMIGNVRWMDPLGLPLLLGASISTHRLFSSTSETVKNAYSVFGGLSLDRFSAYFLKGSVLTELVFAKGWNNSVYNPALVNFFVPDTETALRSAVEKSRSVGWYIQLNYDLLKDWILIYKFDMFALDHRFIGDAFYRHGAGVRYFLNGNSSVEGRLEYAEAGRPNLKGSGVLGAQKSAFLLFHFWL